MKCDSFGFFVSDSLVSRYDGDEGIELIPVQSEDGVVDFNENIAIPLWTDTGPIPVEGGGMECEEQESEDKSSDMEDEEEYA